MAYRRLTSVFQLCQRFSVQNVKAHDALSDINAVWDVIKRLLFPKANSAAEIADVDAEERLLECFACSESFKQFPDALQRGA
jgi:hypothetical protein